MSWSLLLKHKSSLNSDKQLESWVLLFEERRKDRKKRAFTTERYATQSSRRKAGAVSIF
jgi:hypothetical protein